MGARLLTVASLILLAVGATARAACPTPDFALAAWPRPRALPIRVYFDASQSMAGYTRAGRDAPVIADLIQLIADRAAATRQPVNYFAFGRETHAIPVDRARAYAGAAAYNCRACDNQESRIDSVLRRVASDSRRAVSIVVTDLWLDNSSFQGSPQVALGQPLGQIITGGGAVAAVGVRAPFAGKVYDIPGVGSYPLYGERPLFVLVIGPESEVADMVALLRSSGSPAFAAERTKVALFSAGAALPRPVQAPKPSGGGVTVLPSLAILPGVPRYGLDRSLAGRQQGRIVGRFDAGAGVRASGVWHGALAADTNVWVLDDARAATCPATAFRREMRLPSWPRHSGTQAIFQLDGTSAAALRPGHTYLVVGRLGVTRLAVPNPDTDWVRDWSLTPTGASQAAVAHARWYGTLNLADLVGLMEQALVAARPRGRMTIGFQFLLTVT